MGKLRFSNLSIEKKFLVSILFVILITFLSAESISGIFNVAFTKSHMFATVRSTAKMIGNRSVAAILFEDKELADENLAALSSLPEIQLGCIYTNQGLLGHYIASGSLTPSQCPTTPHTKLSEKEHEGFYQVWSPIVSDNETVGRIYLKASLKPIYTVILYEQFINILIVLASIIIAIITTKFVARKVTNPLKSLVTITQSLSEGNLNQTIPDTAFTADEVGMLAKTFDTMLDGLKKTTVSKTYIDSILEAMGDLLFVTDENFLIRRINKVCTRKLGYQMKELIGTPLSTVFHKKGLQQKLGISGDKKEKSATLDTCILNHRDDIELECIKKTGHRIPVAVAIDILPEKTGNGGYVFAAKDMTSLKAKEKAVAANKAKSGFLASMSHEIRTPLNGVVGILSLLEETKLTPKQKDYLDTISQSASLLLHVINDILDFSKIEAGKLEIENISFDLQSLMEKTADILAVTARNKGIELILDVAPDLPRSVIGDPGRIRQVILNLTGNAIKFTEKGHVLLRLNKTEEKGPTIAFALDVVDTGIGIEAKSLKNVFKEFKQADSTTTRKFGGTGLGLSISRKLSKLMSGDITATSEYTKGSTFTFTFKLGKDTANESVALTKKAHLAQKLRVLIVDDNPTNCEVLAKMTASEGCENTILTKGKDVLPLLLEKAKQKKFFDVIFLDYQLPDYNGYDLGKKIKEKALLAKSSLIILSSTARKDMDKKCKKAGFEGYLLKPIKLDYVTNALIVIAAHKHEKKPLPFITEYIIHEAKEKTTNRDTIRFDNVHVLVAEDSILNQKVILPMLESVGCDIICAQDGEEAVTMYEKKKFDLILMDCQMPRKDGFAATGDIRKIEKKNASTRTIIIGCTANAMKGDRERCINAGMDGYLSKPLLKKDVVECLKQWIPEAKQRISSEKNAKKETSTTHKVAAIPKAPKTVKTKTKKGPSEKISPLPKKPSGKAPRIPTDVFDPHMLTDLQETMGKDMVKDLIVQYFDSAKERYEQIKLALKKDNQDELTIAVHTLKGIASQVGANKLSLLCQELEKKLHDNTPIKNLRPYDKAIKNAHDESNKKLKQLLKHFSK